MTGVKEQKIIILQQQRPIFSCTWLRYLVWLSHSKRMFFIQSINDMQNYIHIKCRNLRLRANHALVLLVESKDGPALGYCSIMYIVNTGISWRQGVGWYQNIEVEWAVILGRNYQLIIGEKLSPMWQCIYVYVCACVVCIFPVSWFYKTLKSCSMWLFCL